MKNCEIIRNVTSVLSLGGFGFSVVAGGLGIINVAETAVAIFFAAAFGVVSYIMDKIANEIH